MDFQFDVTTDGHPIKNIFWCPAQAKVVISDWKEDYNHRRRHSSLGYQPPTVYASTCIHR